MCLGLHGTVSQLGSPVANKTQVRLSQRLKPKNSLILNILKRNNLET